jgi:hypothetical protein
LESIIQETDFDTIRPPKCKKKVCA